MFNRIIPFVILFGLLSFLGYELFHANPNELPSALINQPVPYFNLPLVSNTPGGFTNSDLKGQVSLLTVWATWCSACAVEHDMLMKISSLYRVPIYGILYKDQRSNGMQWFKEHGDPFIKTGDDSNGNVGIDLGVYGTPETFVISPDGNIVYRYVGSIDQAGWDNVLLPVLKKFGYRG